MYLIFDSHYLETRTLTRPVIYFGKFIRCVNGYCIRVFVNNVDADKIVAV